ncbi:hypothetical protein Glove_382g31 [Diversispora epigaea]|uniref:FAD-binding domain-containing protein n=1 Tax=Diversispora epigaea TaxID=1348612 RepID=A0A397H8B9_9GLOM|nr:hypothetical protein Glove_382g31 [Diversispora epigaea]
MILKSFHRFKFNRFLHNELFFHKQVVKHCNSRLFATLLPNKSNDESHKNLENIYDIVIVGGGIAGNALACALANSEITKSQRVALIEFSDVSYLKEWKPSPNEFSNRVSALTPQSIEFFKDIGVWKNLVLERVKPFNDIQVWDGITDARLNFNCKDNNTFRTNLENIGWIVENHNIQQAILTQLLQCKDFNFHFFENTKVEGIFLDDSSAYNAPSVNGQFDLSDWPNIKLSDGNFLKTRLLVGADGFNSVVRSFINIESIGWDYDAHAVVATLLVDRLVENVTAWQRFLPTGPIAMLPV